MGLKALVAIQHLTYQGDHWGTPEILGDSAVTATNNQTLIFMCPRLEKS